MGKRFGLRISRVLPSFQSCRSAANTAATPPSTSSGTATPAAFPSTPASSPPPPPPPPTSRLRHVPVVPPSSFLCRCRLPRPSRTPSSTATPSPSVAPHPTCGYTWDADDKWHVVARVAAAGEAPRRHKVDPEEADTLFPPLSLPRPSYRKSVGQKSKRKRRKHRQHPAAPRPSSSSAETRWFTTDDDGEREADEDDDDSETLLASTTDDGDLPGRVSLSAFLRRLTCGRSSDVEGAACKVLRGSTAVVKRSDDPYIDFRQSMAEMVAENGMYSASELEGLLRCFLSLNSHCHHSAIVRAFSDVWDAVFLASASTAGANSLFSPSSAGPVTINKA